jgi:pimeloyl-ACP methyl ester carboxylesterase
MTPTGRSVLRTLRVWFGHRSVRPLSVAWVMGLTLVAACSSPSTQTPHPSPSVSSAATGASGGVDQAVARFYSQKATWGPCQARLQCAKVTVPVHWSAPSGATIELTAARLRSTTPRAPALLMNPGGPGESGVTFLADNGKSFAALNRSFDLVSWDPRGVGASAPVTCLPNDRLDAFYAAEASPDTPEEVRQMVADTKAFIAACRANTGPVLAHVDTLSTARDMDVLRAVLGSAKLNYLGFSYGTFLGTWYAETFPGHVGRFVLDSAVDPSVGSAALTEGQARGFAQAVEAFARNCLQSTSCPLQGSVQQAKRQLADLVTRADSRPLPTSSGRPLTQSLLETGIALGMYSRQLWPVTTQALTAALKGDGTILLAMADYYNGRNRTGVYKRQHDAQAAISCLDQAETRSLAQIAAAARTIAAAYPPLGDSAGWGGATCALWPFTAVVPTRQVHARGAPPILVVGVTNDPATPYKWSRSLASQLSSGVLLTRRGEGHIGYQGGSACTDAAVERFLVTGVAPDDGKVCG